MLLVVIGADVSHEHIRAKVATKLAFMNINREGTEDGHDVESRCTRWWRQVTFMLVLHLPETKTTSSEPAPLAAFSLALRLISARIAARLA